MRSWVATEVPRVPGQSPALRLHDTRSGGLVEVRPDRTARLYVCGITPYDATHLGHAATYLGFDLLYRQWLDRGLDVIYAQNITDVDDPLLQRARETGESWIELAARQTDVFREDMAALRILPPQHLAGVVESLGVISELIEQLGGVSYRVDDDLYLDLSADADFGTLTRLPQAEMLDLFAERGGDPGLAGKRHPLDCLLWRGPRDGEPSWESAVGPGRPGWNVECAAIGLLHLGTGFDVQGGGADLAFPHHEMCASHVRLATGKDHAQVYLHAGMVAFEGEKMSKSLGNLVLIAQLRQAGHDPMAIRLALLEHHYRDDWEWYPAHIHAAEDRLARWRAAVDRDHTAPTAACIEAIRSALANDLDAPAALAAVDAWAGTVGNQPEGPQVARAVDALLGVRL